jgi:ABC-2 type transport system permease protein
MNGRGAGGFLLVLRRMRALLAKEFRQFFREWILLLFMVWGFTGMVYLAGSGVSMSLNNAAMAVLDRDQSRLSREFIRRYPAPEFHALEPVARPGQGVAGLDSGKYLGFLVIPNRFQETLLAGKQAEAQLLVDGSNTVLATFVSAYSQRILGELARDALEQDRPQLGVPKGPRIEAETRTLFNPNRKDSWFTSLTELLNITTLFSMLLPAAAMVREKERGTLEQLLISPAGPVEIMLPKVAAMTVVIVAGAAASLLLVLGPGFDFPMHGSVGAFLAVTALYAAAMAGMGLLVAALSRSLGQAGLMTFLIFAPMMFLSGVWTPPEALPAFIRWLMQLSPLHYYVDLSFGLLLQDAGFSVLWPSVALLALLGSALLGAGLWRLGRQFG